jgi:Tfp pilus assembly protein PilX
VRARRRRGGQEGFALVTAMLTLALALLIGFALVAYVEGQTRAAGSEHQREAGFELAESALSAQGFVLSRAWPASSGSAYPASCGPASTGTTCPAASELAKAYAGAGAASWATQVRDNGTGAPLDYTAAVLSQPTWDANGDGALWIHAHAAAAGRPTTLVALYQLNPLSSAFPRNVITAGSFATGNNGNKLIVDAKGVAGQPAPLAVRCTNPSDTACLDYRAVQVGPGAPITGYLGGSAVPPEALAGLRLRAQLSGTYTASGCPANPSGAVVFIESGNCSYNNSVPGACCNSAASPGILIVANGTLTFNGNLTFYGVIYAANLQASGSTIITVTGNALVQGAIDADGAARVQVGSSKMNLVFDPAGLGYSYWGAAVFGKNTWRQIP